MNLSTNLSTAFTVILCRYHLNSNCENKRIFYSNV